MACVKFNTIEHGMCLLQNKCDYITCEVEFKQLSCRAVKEDSKMELSNSTGLILCKPIGFYLDDLFKILLLSGSSQFPKALCRQCLVSRLSEAIGSPVRSRKV